MAASISRASIPSATGAPTLRDGPSGMVYSLGSVVPEVQTILSDIPLVSVGLLTIALLTIWLANGRFNRAILDIGITGLALFIAAVLQLLDAILCEGTGKTSMRGLGVATSLALALANFKYAFLLRRIEQPSPDERLPSVPSLSKPASDRAKGGYSLRRLAASVEPEHANSWSRFGPFGVWARLFLFFLVALIGLLDAVWRIGFRFTVGRYIGVERAAVVLQMLLLTAVAVKIVVSSRRTSSGPRRRYSTDFVPVLAAVVISFSILIVDLSQTAFVDTALGRVFETFVLYIVLVDYAIREWRLPVRDSLSFPASSDRALSGSFIGIEAPSRASTFHISPPPAPPVPLPTPARSATLDSHVGPVIRRSSGRLPSWLGGNLTRQRLGSDAEQLTAVVTSVAEPDEANETAIEDDAESDCGPDVPMQQRPDFSPLTIPSFYGGPSQDQAGLSPYSAYAAQYGTNSSVFRQPSFIDIARTPPPPEASGTLPQPGVSPALVKARAAAMSAQRPDAQRKPTSRSSDSRSSGGRTVAERLKVEAMRESVTPSVASEAASEFSLSHFPKPPDSSVSPPSPLPYDAPRPSTETTRPVSRLTPNERVTIDGADFVLTPPRRPTIGRDSAQSDDSRGLPTDVGRDALSYFNSGPLPLLRSMPASPTLSDVDASIHFAERRTPPDQRGSPLRQALSVVSPVPSAVIPPVPPAKDPVPRLNVPQPTARTGLPSSPRANFAPSTVRAAVFQQAQRPPSAFKEPRAVPQQPQPVSSRPLPSIATAPASILDKGRGTVRGRQIKLVIPTDPRT